MAYMEKQQKCRLRFHVLQSWRQKGNCVFFKMFKNTIKLVLDPQRAFYIFSVIQSQLLAVSNNRLSTSKP